MKTLTCQGKEHVFGAEAQTGDLCRCGEYELGHGVRSLLRRRLADQRK